MPGDDHPQGRLLQLLGLSFGLAGAVGGTIGAGILRTPGLVAAQLGSAELLMAAWLVGGLYAVLGAICVAELATILPRAGGWTEYAQRAFGPDLGFTVGWMDWLGHCAGLAWVVLTIGEYTVAMAPSLSIGALSIGARTIAIAVLLLFSLIQLLGVQAGGSSLKVLSLAKALAFFVLVVACFLLGGDQAGAGLAGLPAALPGELATGGAVGGVGAAGGVLSITALVVALQAVITTFDGWHSPIYFAEEFTEPEQDLPRSLIGGVLAIITIYLLVNLALLHVLPLPAIAASKLPVADAAQEIFGSLSGSFITVLALVSLLGLVNATIMAAPRILYGLSRDGLFSAWAAQVNGGGTPIAALLLTCLAAIVLVLSGDFTVLLGIASFFYVAIYLSGILALLVLRWREPELPRPFRAWGHPLPALVVMAGSLAFLVAAAINDSSNSLIAALLIAVSVPVHRLARRLEIADV
jgi:APA family basic amino acid/polyamine antiporter